MAIYSLGVPFGTGLGSLLGARVAALYGWRMAFFAVGAPGVLLGLLVLLVIREPRRGRMDVLAEGESAHAAPAPLLATIVSVLKNRTLVITALSSALSAFVGYGTLNNAPAYLMSNKGMSLTEISLYYAAASGLAGGFGTFASGFLVDLFGKRHRTAYALVPAAMTLTGLPFFIAFLFAPAWPTAMLCLVVPLTFGTAYLPAAIATPNDSAGGPNYGYYAAKGALAMAIGVLGAKVVRPDVARQLAAGSFTVMAYELLRPMAQNILPASMSLGWMNPGRIQTNMARYDNTNMGRMGRMGNYQNVTQITSPNAPATGNVGRGAAVARRFG
jgi:predicted MFS family arabinose efflux permease